MVAANDLILEVKKLRLSDVDELTWWLIYWPGLEPWPSDPQPGLFTMAMGELTTSYKPPFHGGLAVGRALGLVFHAQDHNNPMRGEELHPLTKEEAACRGPVTCPFM